MMRKQRCFLTFICSLLTYEIQINRKLRMTQQICSDNLRAIQLYEILFNISVQYVALPSHFRGQAHLQLQGFSPPSLLAKSQSLNIQANKGYLKQPMSFSIQMVEDGSTNRFFLRKSTLNLISIVEGNAQVSAKLPINLADILNTQQFDEFSELKMNMEKQKSQQPLIKIKVSSARVKCQQKLSRTTEGEKHTRTQIKKQSNQCLPERNKSVKSFIDENEEKYGQKFESKLQQKQKLIESLKTEIKFLQNKSEEQEINELKIQHEWEKRELMTEIQALNEFTKQVDEYKNQLEDSELLIQELQNQVKTLEYDKNQLRNDKWSLQLKLTQLQKRQKASNSHFQNLNNNLLNIDESQPINEKKRKLSYNFDNNKRSLIIVEENKKSEEEKDELTSNGTNKNHNNIIIKQLKTVIDSHEHTIEKLKKQIKGFEEILKSKNIEESLLLEKKKNLEKMNSLEKINSNKQREVLKMEEKVSEISSKLTQNKQMLKECELMKEKYLTFAKKAEVEMKSKEEEIRKEKEDLQTKTEEWKLQIQNYCEVVRVLEEKIEKIEKEKENFATRYFDLMKKIPDQEHTGYLSLSNEKEEEIKELKEFNKKILGMMMIGGLNVKESQQKSKESPEKSLGMLLGVMQTGKNFNNDHDVNEDKKKIRRYNSDDQGNEKLQSTKKINYLKDSSSEEELSTVKKEHKAQTCKAHLQLKDLIEKNSQLSNKNECLTQENKILYMEIQKFQSQFKEIQKNIGEKTSEIKKLHSQNNDLVQTNEKWKEELKGYQALIQKQMLIMKQLKRNCCEGEYQDGIRSMRILKDKSNDKVFVRKMNQVFIDLVRFQKKVQDKKLKEELESILGMVSDLLSHDSGH